MLWLWCLSMLREYVCLTMEDERSVWKTIIAISFGPSKRYTDYKNVYLLFRLTLRLEFDGQAT